MHPGQIAFDLYSAELALDALDGREEFGFTFDPSHLHWQGVDPVEFLRRFPDRIYHVHIKDVALTLNGRTGVLEFVSAHGDPRRGWDFRSPGHGGIDWEAIIRALNEIGYDGPLAVEWKDAGMDRDYGAEEACKFVKRLDFEPAPRLQVAQASGIESQAMSVIISRRRRYFHEAADHGPLRQRNDDLRTSGPTSTSRSTRSGRS